MGSMLVCMGAMLKCSFGDMQTPFNIIPQNKVSAILPYANINDHIPLVNIIPFGNCKNIANPVVAAASAKPPFVLTPMPCLPVTVSQWTKPAKKANIGNAPAITKNSKLMCMWGGQIEVSFAGQATVIN